MPLKRDPSLIPLSHDHHHGLHLALLIRKAVKAQEGLADQVVATRDFFAANLVAHFRAEEDVLFPVLRAVPGLEQAALSRLLEEHRVLERMVEQLDASAERLTAFADLLERHIRYEEREVFGRYQEHVPASVRAEVAAGIRRVRNA